MHDTSICVDSTTILTRSELQSVLADPHAKAARSRNAHRNLILVRPTAAASV